MTTLRYVDFTSEQHWPHKETPATYLHPLELDESETIISITDRYTPTGWMDERETHHVRVWIAKETA